MALSVEVAGYGICHTENPYSVMVICVQQEAFQAWTVYRRISSFYALAEQLKLLHPGTAPFPFIDATSLQHEDLENCRAVLDTWLKTVASNSLILRTQSMYQFLCVEANQPPPFLEVHWRMSSNGSFDEMDMEEMFEKDEEYGNNDGDDWEHDEEEEAPQTVFAVSQQTIGGAPTAKGQPGVPVLGSSGSGSGNNRSPVDRRFPHKTTPRGHPIPPAAEQRTVEEEENDGLDIQSLSVMEAEFMYDRGENTGKKGVVEIPAELSTDVPKRKISLESFDIIKVIGKGSFGKVFLVRDKATGSLHALKVLKKEYIIKKNQVEHTKTERQVLGYIHHPYIVGLTMAFQTADKLFFVLDYCPGGELFFHLGKVGRFPEPRAKFYAAQITLALEYVHNLGIIYRDLKPENVLLDQAGNIRLTDFGLSKAGVSHHSQGANSFCGTPEYIAPEVLLREGHGRAVDWWSLGALLYEMIAGLPPFYSRSREAMFEKIIHGELTFPHFMSKAAIDILSKMLVRDPTKRLGSGEKDAQEIKEHFFFSDVDWVGLMSSNVVPPWTPSVAGSLDVSQFDKEFTSLQAAVTPDVRGAYFAANHFDGFTFVDDSANKLLTRAMSNSTNSNSTCSTASNGHNRLSAASTNSTNVSTGQNNSSPRQGAGRGIGAGFGK